MQLSKQIGNLGFYGIRKDWLWLHSMVFPFASVRHKQGRLELKLGPWFKWKENGASYCRSCHYTQLWRMPKGIVYETNKTDMVSICLSILYQRWATQVYVLAEMHGQDPILCLYKGNVLLLMLILFHLSLPWFLFKSTSWIWQLQSYSWTELLQ